MRRRLFTAISIPPALLKEIDKKVKKLGLAPNFRFLPPDNWHITISFLGDQDDGDILKITSAIEETAANFEAPEITFEKFIPAPPGKTPRMIWLTLDSGASARLSKIKFFLEERLAENGIRFAPEERKFNGHVTLARFSEPPGGINELNRGAPWRFVPRDLELFESVLKRSGAEYFRLGGFDFR